MARESKSRAEFSSDLWIASWMVGILGSEAEADALRDDLQRTQRN